MGMDTGKTSIVVEVSVTPEQSAIIEEHKAFIEQEMSAAVAESWHDAVAKFERWLIEGGDLDGEEVPARARVASPPLDTLRNM